MDAKPKMKTELETITPAIAAMYLKKNTSNRTMRDKNVAFLANEITAGRWQVTNQGIAFTADGTLADGQHRLEAVVRSGGTIQCLVTRGLPAEAVSAIDVGSKRSVGDYLHLHHGIENANAMAASARMIVSIFFGHQNIQPPAAVIKMVIDNYGNDISAAIAAGRAFKPAASAMIFAPLALARHRHAERIDSFLNGLATGEKLKVGDPAHTMREWLITRGDHFKGSYRGTRIDAALNILMYQVLGKPYRMVKSSQGGLHFFTTPERHIIESIRREIPHLLQK